MCFARVTLGSTAIVCHPISRTFKLIRQPRKQAFYQTKPISLLLLTFDSKAQKILRCSYDHGKVMADLQLVLVMDARAATKGIGREEIVQR